MPIRRAVRPALFFRVAMICALLLVRTPAARAQSESSWTDWTASPIEFADGHVTLGGDVSASFGSHDAGFFNYTDYDHSALRLLRVNLAAVVKATDHLAILGDLETENLDSVRPYALYARIRPWTARDIDIQVGRIPPTFGAFSRRPYVSDNPLIGYPLAYQYLTSLRSDALPATATELLSRKGNGWLVGYSVGSPTFDHGVPLVSAFRWDTGVQAHASMLKDRMLSATVSVTNGTVSNPLFKDDNGGKQVAGRLEWKPIAGLAIGGSAAQGEFVGDSAATAALGPAADGRRFVQTAWGVDAEYSRGYYLFRTETIFSSWQIPFAAEPNRRDPLTAFSTFVEGKYKIRPGLYAAARYDYLGFGTISTPTVTTTWDAPVTRIEFGAGYSILRNVLLKGTYQHDRRDGGRLTPVEHLLSTQVVFWF